MRARVRYGLYYEFDGAVLDGVTARRPFAVASAHVVMHVDARVDLHVGLWPDVIEYRHDDDTLDLLVPLLSQEWISAPFRLRDHPRLWQACETGEVSVRVITSSEDRVFHATHLASARWSSSNPAAWSPGSIRDRLLIQIGRDGVPSAHASASKVRAVRHAEPGEHCVELHDLVVPTRSTCVFCGTSRPQTKEHLVPVWAKDVGERGITVAACDRCNNGLSDLESHVADISRRETSDLAGEEAVLVGIWGIKTMWVIGRALGIDPLRGVCPEVVRRLAPATATAPASSPVWSIAEVFCSREASESLRFLKYTEADVGRPWAMLRVANLVVSVWLGRTTP